LKRELSEKVTENEARYGSFSERLREIIKKFEEGLLTAAQHIEELRKVAQDLKAEDEAHKDTGLTREGFGVLRILEAHKSDSTGPDLQKLETIAEEIDVLYRDD